MSAKLTLAAVLLVSALCAAAGGVHCQNVGSPAAQMTNDFRTAGNNCEEGFARLDSFVTRLSADPNVSGAIIFYGDSNRPAAARNRKRQLANYLKIRKYDSSRITFIDGPAVKDGRTQFWIVPAGAAMPQVLSGDGSIVASRLESPEPKEPYLFGAEYSDGVEGCGPSTYDLAEYAAALKADPKSRGHIVIRETSRVRSDAKLREILSELKSKGIPSSRLTIVYQQVRPARALESTELWIVPARP